jgi:hypothetical protein
VEGQPGNESLNTPTIVAMIVSLAAMYYVAHGIAHVIVTEYGLLGGFITCGATRSIEEALNRWDIGRTKSESVPA